MDNRLSYLLMYEKGAKLKMDLSFGNTNLKLAITGSRELISYEDFVAAISPLLPQVPFQLISFQSVGLDELIQRFARENNYNIYFYTPQWDKYGRSGGFIRNMELVDFLNKFSRAEIIYINSSKDNRLLTNLKELCSNKDIQIKEAIIKSQG